MMKNKLLFSMLSAAALSVAVLFTDAVSNAAAPFHERQVPGLYRTKVGALEVTTLLDGTTTFESQLLALTLKRSLVLPSLLSLRSCVRLR